MFLLVRQPMMDRNKADELPKLQCGFIDFVCTFVYKVRRLFICFFESESLQTKILIQDIGFVATFA